jgi:hypothetical protein
VGDGAKVRIVWKTAKSFLMGAFQIVAFKNADDADFHSFFICENLHHLRHLRFNRPELMRRFEMHSQ